MHNMHTLYHIKRQYANIRPRGRDEKRQKTRFYLSLPVNLRTFFCFFKHKDTKKAGRNHQQNHTNDERKEFFLLFNICGRQFSRPEKKHPYNNQNRPTPPQVRFHKSKILMQLPAILRQPPFSTLYAKTIQLTHSRPKFRRMVHMLCMCQFVHNHISHNIP